MDFFQNIDFTPFVLSFKLAFITTLILLVISIPVSYILSFYSFKGKTFIETIIALPLVLPPSVLGFYLLIILSKKGFLGSFWEKIAGHQLAFHFEGLVIASVIYSLPFTVHPLITGFKSINKSIVEASYTLGKSKITTLFKVILPNMKPSILTAMVLSFTHTIGEFGVVLMVGGSIEGETKVASIAIYDYVESLDYHSAHVYSAILFGFSFLVLFAVYTLNKKLEIKY